MGCNCKNINDGKEMMKMVDETYKSKKIPFWTKIKMICDFLTFYFFFVNTAVINFIVTDKLEPVLPTKLVKKYESYG